VKTGDLNLSRPLQTDGYDGYEEPGRQPGITHVGCWAHYPERSVIRSKRRTISLMLQFVVGQIKSNELIVETGFRKAR
jgi:hypothetical protein